MMTEFADVFSRYCRSRTVSEFLHGVVSLADDHQLSRDTLDALYERLGIENPSQTKGELLDLLLYYIRHALADDELNDKEMQTIRTLKRLFRIDEGDFINFSSDEVAELLGVQLKRILADNLEGLHKVRLQEVFGPRI